MLPAILLAAFIALICGVGWYLRLIQASGENPNRVAINLQQPAFAQGVCTWLHVELCYGTQRVHAACAPCPPCGCDVSGIVMVGERCGQVDIVAIEFELLVRMLAKAVVDVVLWHPVCVAAQDAQYHPGVSLLNALFVSKLS
jgi:hypothetical protein